MNDSTLAPEMLTQAEILAMVNNERSVVRLALARSELHVTPSSDTQTWTVEKACANAWAAGELCEHSGDDNPRRLSIADYAEREPIAFAPIYDAEDPRWAVTMLSQEDFDEDSPEERGMSFIEWVRTFTPLRTVAQMTDCGFAGCDWNYHVEGAPRSAWTHVVTTREFPSLCGFVDVTGTGDDMSVHLELDSDTLYTSEQARSAAEQLDALKVALLEAADRLDSITTATTARPELVDVAKWSAPFSEARAAWDAEHGEDLAALRPAWADDRDPVDGFGFGGPEFQDVAFESAPFTVYGSTMRWVRGGVYNTGSRTIDWDSDARLMLGDLAFRSIAYLEDYLELLREGADAMAALHDSE